ncbi:cupin domain-containing protein [Timonella senegalensis]|uniref:cupin domain-containing protein n=2 Tax=Timonella senegalensis TaxID=1465825 RepID=UPI0028A71CD7|nr:cupin domain-containing protein [Timonella senegalensis]
MTQFPIVVEVVEGEIEFEVNGNRTQLGTGGLIHLEASLLHAVHATTRARINIYLVKAAKG